MNPDPSSQRQAVSKLLPHPLRAALPPELCWEALKYSFPGLRAHRWESSIWAGPWHLHLNQLLGNAGSDESPRLRMRVPPPEDIGVSACGAEIGADRPGFDFAFNGLASGFPSVKWGCLLPVALLRVSQGFKEAEDGSMSNKRARHDSRCHSILQAGGLGSSPFNQPSGHLSSTTVYRAWGDVGLRASYQ